MLNMQHIGVKHISHKIMNNNNNKNRKKLKINVSLKTFVFRKTKYFIRLKNLIRTTVICED